MRKLGMLLVGFGWILLGTQLPLAWSQTANPQNVAPQIFATNTSFQAAAAQVPSTPQAPGRPNADQLTQPPAAFSEAAPTGTEGPGGYAPQMLGDSLSYTTAKSLNPLNASRNARVVAVLAGSAFKIADNETIRPENRVFVNVTDFVGVDHSLLGPGAERLRFTREIFGFEKTFLDGTMSFGMRLPFFQFHDQLGGSSSDFGDVTFIGKAILYENPDSHNLLVGGLALTLPTGPNQSVSIDTPLVLGGAVVPGAFTSVAEHINPTIIQPYVGFLVNLTQDMYIQGFSSMAFTTDDRVPTVWFNDVSAGYFVYRGAEVSIAPTAELHVTTPLSHQGSNATPIGVIDTVDTTLGTHFIWNNGLHLTLGWGFPLTGPQPFASELIAQVTWVY